MTERILQPASQLNLNNQAVVPARVGARNLSDQILNQTILNAAASRRTMYFTDTKGVQLNTFAFSLNPQRVARQAKAVEVEFPTMASWHTYRWMIEPPIWIISGYAGFLGREILQNIIDIDGQDNVFWVFPFVFSNARNVKILSTQVQHDAPFSARYQIVLRELPTIARNYIPAQSTPFRTTNSFLSPSFITSSIQKGPAKWTIQPNEQDLSTVARDIFQQQKSTMQPNDQIKYMEIANPIKSDSWTGQGPTSMIDGSILTELVYQAG